MKDETEQFLDQFEKLHKQRAILMAMLALLMDSEFEDPAVSRYKVAMADAFADRICKQDLLLGDDAEEAVLKSCKQMLEREQQLLNIKEHLNEDPL